MLYCTGGLTREGKYDASRVRVQNGEPLMTVKYSPDSSILLPESPL